MLIARVEQHMKVTGIVAESVNLDEVKENYPKLANYMCRNISIMLAISSIHLLLRGDEQAKVWYGQLWSDIKGKTQSCITGCDIPRLAVLQIFPAD